MQSGARALIKEITVAAKLGGGDANNCAYGSRSIRPRSKTCPDNIEPRSGGTGDLEGGATRRFAMRVTVSAARQ
jgi:hypothetical protein